MCRLRDVLRNQRGAVDLPSIMVGAIVLGLLTAAILATVFTVIPWAQDNAAKQKVSQIVSAQSVYYAMTTDGSALHPQTGEPRPPEYGSVEDLVHMNLLAGVDPDPTANTSLRRSANAAHIWASYDMDRKIQVQTVHAGGTVMDADKFQAWVRSDTGKVFTASDHSSQAHEGEWGVFTESGNLLPDPYMMTAETVLGGWMPNFFGVEKPGASFQSGRYFRHQDFDVTPGETLTIKATRDTTAGPDTGRVSIHFRDATGGQNINTVANYLGVALSMPRDGQFEHTFTVPAGVDRIAIGYFTEPDMTSATTVQLKDIGIYRTD